MKVKYLLPLAGLGLAGCSWLPSVGPDYEPPKFAVANHPLPDAGYPTTNCTEIGEYKSADGEDDFRVLIQPEQVREWWNQFDDSVLTGLVACAVNDNLSYRMARERLIASRWQLIGAYAKEMPEIDANGTFLRKQNGRYTPSRWSTQTKEHTDFFSVGFDATWEIDIFGGNRRYIEASWAKYRAEEWRLADTWVSLTSEVGSKYVELRTMQQRIETARTNLVLQSETYDILKSRLDSGIGDELAVNQSKYVVDQTHARIPTLLAQEERLINAIEILVGVMPGTLHEQLRTLPSRDWLVQPIRLEAIPLDMIRARPDIRVAERQLAAQVANVGYAKSFYYPKFFLNGSLGLSSPHLDTTLRRRALVGSLGPSFSWPIFQGGNIRANVKAEEARVNEAYYNYELTLQTAFGQVRDAYAAYTQEYHRYQALKGAVKAAQDAVTISKDLYKNGLRDFTAVIDSQRSLLNLQEELVSSRGDITRDLIALYKALGGGFAVADPKEEVGDKGENAESENDRS